MSPETMAQHVADLADSMGADLRHSSRRGRAIRFRDGSYAIEIRPVLSEAEKASVRDHLRSLSEQG